MHAPQRMHASASRKVSSARSAERPLSTMTTCSSPPRIGAWKWVVYVVEAWPVARAGEEAEEDAEVLEPRHELLHAHARDVDGRERGAHVGVALVRADDHAAGLRDREVHAGEAGLRRHEPLAEVPARRLGELLRIREPLRRAEVVVEELADLLLLLVDGGQHDVGGRLARELHDPLAEIGVDHLDAARLEVGRSGGTPR